MKKVLLFLIVIMLCCSACSPIEIHGIEAYSPADSSADITRCLFPTTSFLSEFSYHEGDYYYCDSENWKDFIWGYETVYAYLKYTPSEYEQAKACCMDNFVFCDVHQQESYDCCGRMFLHVIDPNDAYEKKTGIDCRFPEHFNLFAYDDQNCMLFFLGYWNGDPDDAETTLIREYFSQFIHDVFPDLYRILEETTPE